MIAWLRRLFESDPDEGQFRQQLDRFAEVELEKHGPAHRQEPARGLTAKLVKVEKKPKPLRGVEKAG